MTPKQSPLAVQRYDRVTDMMLKYSNGTYVLFEDYQRDIAAAERRGAEKAREMSARIYEDGLVDDVADAIRSLSIEQILKGE